MKRETPRSLNLFEQLSLDETHISNIRQKVLFEVFRSYVITLPDQPVDLSPVPGNLLHDFSGKDLVCAAYIFGAIEQETQKGENFTLLEDLYELAHEIYGTADINPEQFKTTCNTLTGFYINSRTTASNNY